MAAQILYQKEDHIATITLNRPDKLNALSIEMMRELNECCLKVNNDSDIRVVVLRGAGERAFCAGSDIESFESYSTPWEYRNREDNYLRSIRSVRKPIIVMIHGFAIGGGLEIAINGGDIRYATEDTKIGAPEINWGWIPGGGSTQLLPRIVGAGRAAEILLTGEFINGAFAAEIGLVNRAFPTYAEMESYTYETARKIAEKAPIAAQLVKHSIRISMNTTLDVGLDYENELNYIAFSTEDKLEGERAFKEKRKPVFKGR